MDIIQDKLREELETATIKQSDVWPRDTKKNSSSCYQMFLPSDWLLLVVEFNIEDQDSIPGSKGYEGTATRAGTILHLTHELAKLAYKKAKGIWGEGAKTDDGT